MAIKIIDLLKLINLLISINLLFIFINNKIEIEIRI